MGFLIRFAAASGGMTVAPMPAGRSLAPLADIPDCQRRDGPPELVIGREYSWLVSRWQAMPGLPRWRHEIGEPVQKLKRRELDDAIGRRLRGRSAASRANPVGSLVSGKHVADFRDAAARVTSHGKSLEGKRRPGAVSEQMLEAPKIA